MWKYWWSFCSLQFSDLKSQWTATSLLNSELMTFVTLLECAPIGNKNTTLSIYDLKYRKSSIKPHIKCAWNRQAYPGLNRGFTVLKEQYVFTLVTQGQEVGKQNHDIRMVCIEKEIEMARSIGVSVFFYVGRFSRKIWNSRQNIVTSNRQEALSSLVLDQVAS